MKFKKFGNTEQRVYDLVRPITDELGYYLWDVSYVKEGAMWYLRIFIDCDEGITIDDCEKATRPIDEALDAADPDVSLIIGLGAYKLGKEDKWAGSAGEAEWIENPNIIQQQIELAEQSSASGYALYY